MRYVAAFRTYTWNDDVKRLADRFFAACPSGHPVILADETRGPLGITGYAVISHTEDTAHLGLPVQPRGKSLWFNVDYGLYILRHAMSGYDHYLLSESDLAVNLPLDPMMQAVTDRGIDFITHDLRRSEPGWHWHRNASAVFEDPWGCLLFFIVASARAADLLLAERRHQAEEQRAGRLPAWPFCEPFVASVLKKSGLAVAEVSEFAATHNLRFRPRIPLDDPRADEPGTLVHSVVSRWDCFREQAARHPGAWFAANGKLRQLAAPLPLSECAAVLKAAFEAKADFAGAARLAMELAPPRPAPPIKDLALCKPSLSSSTSPWSHFDEPVKDAAGANGHDLPREYGFHTALETSPSWLVDLLDSYAISRVEILNRPDMEDRFTQFVVESSSTSVAWTTQFVKIDAALVSSAIDDPFAIDFTPPFVARFVRIRQLAKGYLHLRRVRVLGRDALAH